MLNFLVETKHEYTIQLVNMLTPLIYEGLQSIYSEVVKISTPENILKNWQEQGKEERTLVIIRPTVVFGEKNRGNIYNLMRQISTGKFVMIGNGENKKSIAYVGNLAAFIKYCLNFMFIILLQVQSAFSKG
jgi:uncharacterized protein YybS (DUF2232 family)